MGILLGWLLAAALALLSAGASAQVPPIPPCIDSIALWTTPYSTGTIQSTSYYPEISVLTVLPRGFNWQYVYVNVPQSIAQQLAAPTTNADGYYNSNIKNRYLQALLSELGCPLLAEATGAMLLAEIPGTPPPLPPTPPIPPTPPSNNYLLLLAGGNILLLEGGKLKCAASC